MKAVPPPVEGPDPARLRALVLGQRWAAFGTLEEGPCLSWVAYAVAGGELILHLSRLARHTRNLLANPAAALAVTEADDGRGDPQTLARVTLYGQAEPVDRAGADYEEKKSIYLQRLPDAEPLFEFADFELFRFVLREGHYVEGFGRSHRLQRPALMEMLSGS